MLKKVLLLIVSLYVYSGCNSKHESSVPSIVVDVERAQAVDIAEGNKLKKQLIPLDTSEQALIDVVNDVVIYDTLFFIRTRGKLIKFDYTGKFCGSISAQGQAGNEYVDLTSIWHRGDTLYLHDMNGKKVLLYGLDNKLISTISLSHEASSNPFSMLIPLNEEGYIGKMVYKGRYEISHELAYYANNCSFRQAVGNTQLTSGLNLGYPFSKYDKMVLYWRQLENYIYSVDESLTLRERYHVDFGKKNAPLKNDNLKNEYDIIGYINRHAIDCASMISNVVESDKHVVFRFLSSKKKYLAVYDKTSKTSKSFYFVNNSQDIEIVPIHGEKVMIFSFGEKENGVVYKVNIQDLMNQ